MARLAKFSPAQIVDATAQLAAQGGPARATMARIAAALGAPTGSLYYRFGSRDELLGTVWLEAAEAFQEAFAACLEAPEPWEAGRAAALFVPARVRQEPAQARILLLHRRDDFMAPGWPAAMTERAALLKRQSEAALRRFAKRLLGRADAEAMRNVAYALVHAPLAAVLPHLRAGEVPPASVEAVINATYVAVMALSGAQPTRLRPVRSKG